MARIYDLVDTWNDAGTTFTAIKMNVTDTASDAASLLMDLQVGGSSKFKVDKAGTLFSNTINIGNNERLQFNSSSYSFFRNTGQDGGAIQIVTNSNAWGAFRNEGFVTSKEILFSSSAFFIANVDLRLGRDAADTLAQRNSTNAQTFNIYNTYTDASNYERSSIKETATGLVIDQQYAGTGLERGNLLDLQVGGSSKFSVSKLGILNNISGVEFTNFGNFSFNFPSGHFVIEDYDGARILSFQRRNLGFRLIETFLGFTQSYSSTDLRLYRDAANTLAQRNGVNAQTFNLYNTYTDGSNYERASFTQTATGLVLDAQYLGTGTEPDNILELKSGGSSKFRVDKIGTIYGPGFSLGTGAGFAKIGGSTGTLYAYFASNSTQLNGQSFFISSLADGIVLAANNRNLVLNSTGNQPVEIRNSTNPQTFRLYNTYTDSSNYERGFMKWNSNVLEIGTEADGSGTARPVSFPSLVKLSKYSETGTSLSISSGVLDVPLDGQIYTVNVTEQITSITTSSVPTAPECGSAVVYFIQDTTGYAVALPNTWYWADAIETAIDSTASTMTRLTLYTDPVGNTHADAEIRGIPA